MRCNYVEGPICQLWHLRNPGMRRYIDSFLKMCVSNYPDNGILQAHCHKGFTGNDVKFDDSNQCTVLSSSQPKKKGCHVIFQKLIDCK